MVVRRIAAYPQRVSVRPIAPEMIGFDSSDASRFTPYRPTALRIANATLRLLDRSLGRVFTPDEDALIRKACRKTGLCDFGDDEHREPLSVLCEHLRTGKPTTAFGRLMLRADLLTRLANKLKIHAELSRVPEILERPVREPIFVLGLPRTGTTLLQRLLDADPQNHGPRIWEMNQPVPAPDPESFESDPRIREFERGRRAFDYAAPAVKMMHEGDTKLPDECLLLMANGLISGWYCFAWDSPYLDWFMARDHTSAYRFHKRQLQLLQWKFPQRRWVLKAPWHLFSLDALIEVYPDARIVQLHRDPLDVLPSLASLWTTARAAMYEEVDPSEVGAEATRRAFALLGRGMEARSREEGRPGSGVVFQDVLYRDLVKDPIATVAKLYRGFRLDFGEEAEARMCRHLEGSPQHKYGRHRYRPEQFGIDVATERARYGAYCERFGLQPR